MALAAKHHDVGFFVAAPFSSIDSTIPSGDQIVIEERPGSEVTHIGGNAISPDGNNFCTQLLRTYLFVYLNKCTIVFQELMFGTQLLM